MISEIDTRQKKYLIYGGVALFFFLLIVMPLLVSYGIGKGISGYVVAEINADEQTEIKYEGIQGEITITQEEISSIEEELPQYQGNDSTIQGIIDTAKDDMFSMAKEGLGIVGVKNLIIELYDEANNFRPDYNAIVQKANEITVLKERAFSLQALLNRKELEILEFEKLTETIATKAWDLHKKATVELKNEEYNAAEKTLGEITPLLNELQVKDSFWLTLMRTRENKTVAWVSTNVPTFIIIVLVMWLLVYATGKKVKIFLLRRKIDYLVIEQDLIEDFIKKAETEFKNKIITRSMYLMKIKMYETRKEDIERELPLMKEKLHETLLKKNKRIKEGAEEKYTEKREITEKPVEKESKHLDDNIIKNESIHETKAREVESEGKTGAMTQPGSDSTIKAISRKNMSAKRITKKGRKKKKAEDQKNKRKKMMLDVKAKKKQIVQKGKKAKQTKALALKTTNLPMVISEKKSIMNTGENQKAVKNVVSLDLQEEVFTKNIEKAIQKMPLPTKINETSQMVSTKAGEQEAETALNTVLSETKQKNEAEKILPVKMPEEETTPGIGEALNLILGK